MCCICDLCVCMSNVISELNSEIEGSHASCALMKIYVFYFMSSESSLHLECILSFGILCLSVWRMMFVNMVFAVCISGSG